MKRKSKGQIAYEQMTRYYSRLITDIPWGSLDVGVKCAWNQAASAVVKACKKKS